MLNDKLENTLDRCFQALADSLQVQVFLKLLLFPCITDLDFLPAIPFAVPGPESCTKKGLQCWE